jgi:hypothetical protein
LSDVVEASRVGAVIKPVVGAQIIVVVLGIFTNQRGIDAFENIIHVGPFRNIKVWCQRDVIGTGRAAAPGVGREKN